eukprot:RCo045968
MCTVEDRQYLEENCVCDIFEELLQNLLKFKPSKSDIPGFLAQVLTGSSPEEAMDAPHAEEEQAEPTSSLTFQNPRSRLQLEDEPSTLRISYGMHNMRRQSLQQTGELSLAFEEIESKITPEHTNLLIVDHYNTASLLPLKGILERHKQISSLVFVSCTFLSSGQHSLSALVEPLTGNRCGVEELAFDGCSFVSKVDAWKPGAEDEVTGGNQADILASILSSPEGTSVKSLFMDQINPRGAQALFEALAKPKAPLVELVLVEASMDPGVLQALTAMLKTNQTLQGLSLANSSFDGVELGIALSIGLAVNRSLRCLDISQMAPEGDPISQDGLEEIIKALESNPDHQLADLYAAVNGGGPQLSSSWQQRLQVQLRKNAHLLADPTIALLPVNFWRGSSDD